MKKRIKITTILLLAMFLLTGIIFPPSKTVKINNKVWMTKNLDVDKFRNGEPILQVSTSEEWLDANYAGKPAYCYYTDDVNGEKYGKYYNWYAVNDPRGLAPKGWHIPSDEEWLELSDYLGGNEVAGIKMKTRTGWGAKESNDPNESGFSGTPSGFFDGHKFHSVGYCGHWWSSSDTTYYFAWGRRLCSRNNKLGRDYYGKDRALSVLCIKD